MLCRIPFSDLQGACLNLLQLRGRHVGSGSGKRRRMENICTYSCNFKFVRDLIGKKKQKKNKKTEIHKRVEELKNRAHGADSVSAISKDSCFLDVDKYRREAVWSFLAKMIKTHPTNHLLVVPILNPRISRYGEIELGEGRRANIYAICST